MFLEPVSPAPPRTNAAGPLDGLEAPAKAAEDRAAEEQPWQPMGYFDLRYPVWPLIAGPPPVPFFHR